MQSSTANLNTALADATKGLNLPSKTRVNRLSNTFARLRTRSPSASTSRSSNRSTPSSVLLTSLTHMPDLESHAGVDSAAEPRDSISKGLKLTGLDIRHSGNDDDSIANTQAVNEKTEYRPPLSAAATNRKEAWQTSDDSFKTPRFNDERVDPSLQRLGVLPSPGKDSSSFTGEFLGQNKTYHGTKDLAEDENIEQSSSNCDMSLAFNLDHLSGDRIKNVSSNVHVRFETANIAGVENMPDTALPSAYEQSVQETIFNGRTSLPSQRRLSAQGPPTPTNALGFWRRSIGNVEILNEHEPTGLASEEAHAQAAASEVSKARTQLGPHDRAAHEHEGSVLCLSHATNNPEPSVKCPTSLDIASDDQNLDSPPTLLKSQDRADESEISEESLLESKVRHLTLGLSFDRDIETRDKSDLESRRSSVSSLDHSIEDHEKGWMFQKQQHEGSQEPPQTLVSVALAVPHAPRSALSANVFQNNNELAGVQKDDNAATVSPVQPSSHLHTVPSDFPQFMARSHHGPVASDERPMSYLPLPRDSSGYPMAETIDTVQAGLSVSPLVDLSVFSGPPPGTPPFLQHPAFRQPSPGFVRSEFSKKKTVQSAEKASDSMINSKEVAAEENAPPVQLSNLVQTPDGPVEWKDGVARRQTTLIAPDRANVLQSEAELVPVSRVLQRDLQPGKRISGLWDSFKRSSMAFKDDTRDDDHEKSGPWKHTAASKVREPINAPNTLKKKHSQRVPQKSDSATVPPTEPRKKRFSGISSLFNRSNVTAAKPVKLTKPDQREKDNARHGNNGPNKSNNASVTGMISGYESYEAMRRQQIRDFSTGYPGAELQLPQLNKELPPPPRASSMPLQQANDPAKTSTELTTSAQRYSEISSSTANRTENHDHGAAQFSNLPGPANIKSLSLLPHGVLKPNATRHLSLDTIIPQAFMPTEASYGERIKAVGPPPNGSTAQTYLHTARDKAVTPSPAPWNYENFASTRTTYNGMETRHYPMSQQAMDPVSPPTPYDHSQPRHSISPKRKTRATDDDVKVAMEKPGFTGVGYETQGRRFTLSIALPGSIIGNARTLERRTALAGQIARACAVFGVDEIVVFNDSLTLLEEEDCRGNTTSTDPNEFPFRLLSYLETPPYLRRALFAPHVDFGAVDTVPGLDVLHHSREEEWCAYREGVAVRQVQKRGEVVTVLDCGIEQEVIVPVQLEPATRVTVKMAETSGDGFLEGEAVSPCAPREENGFYWGYTARLAASLSAVFTECPFDGGYDMSVGTSSQGEALSYVLEARHESHIAPDWNHLLLVFGGEAGLEGALSADKDLQMAGVTEAKELFDRWVNLVPGQACRTIRTDEAIWIGLTGLSGLVLTRANH
ncbi:DUF171-domain-containing protein [Acrodontium crateriforme]|uniref:DUF171-domain-containing protein n=1 Tax=Acrodontium crateriforme TaxID=150365 RepID=A0AAQ3M6E2_9PEZI|nr:DUF171-domain-containing protein [Acrodontium crateriforme]